MESYPEIKNIVMASSTQIERVTFLDLPALSDVTYANGEIEEDDLLLTKDSALETAANVVVTGYGKHSGRKLWQLPVSIKNELKKLLVKKSFTEV